MRWQHAVPLFLAVVWPSCSPDAVVASAAQLQLVLTTSPLLPSSNLSACIVASNSTCVGGITAAAAYVRGWQRQGRAVVWLPKLDHSSVFVQMAQAQLSVNIPVFQRLGLRYFSVSSPVISDVRPADDGLLTPTVMLACGNAPTLPSNKWFGYTVRSYYDQRMALIPLVDETQPFCEGVVDAVREAVVDAWRRYSPALDFTVVLHRSSSDPQSFADAVVQFAVPPDIVLLDPPLPPGFQLGYRNRTLFVQFGMSDTTLTRLTLNYTYQGPNATNATPRLDAYGVDTVALAALGPAFQDADYFAQRQFLRGLAAAALSNNPTLALATGPMPLTRAGDQNVCFAGACPIGGLFTDAARWQLGVDLVVETSGGLRGPGWPAGPIRVSDMWAALPFANTLCTAQLLGLTVWEIFNRSMALATFSNQITTTGDRLLQVSGARVHYNPALYPVAGRVTAIDVWDAASQQFKPLERLKLYSVGTHNYECNTFDLFPTFFSGRYRGEVKGHTLDITIQTAVMQYLQSQSTYSIPLIERLVNTTDITPMPWLHSQATCPRNTMFDAGVRSCIDCPRGQYQPDTGQDACIDEPAQPLLDSAVNWVLKVVPATVAVALGLAVLALAGVLYLRRRSRRDLNYAPTAGTITLLFSDIQASTKMWALAPESMARSLDLHHRLIRDCIRRHKAYEVKTVGDSFMVALRSAREGLSLAVDIQLALQQHQFPRAIERIYRGDLRHIDDTPEDLAPLHPLWNGLRVRIGLHTGEPDCVFDPVSKGYDYYGPDVNVAARVEGLAQGGQILATESVVADVVVDKERMNIQYLGCASLRGIVRTVAVHQVTIPSLLQRAHYFENSWLAVPDDEEASNATMSHSPSNAGLGLADLLRQHPFVRQRVMGAEELETSMAEVSETLTNAMRLLPSSTSDVLIKALAKSWRVREERTPEETLQMVALRAMPSMPRYRKRVEANVAGRQHLQVQHLQVLRSRGSLSDLHGGVEEVRSTDGGYSVLLPNTAPEQPP